MASFLTAVLLACCVSTCFGDDPVEVEDQHDDLLYSTMNSILKEIKEHDRKLEALKTDMNERITNLEKTITSPEDHSSADPNVVLRYITSPKQVVERRQERAMPAEFEISEFHHPVLNKLIITEEMGKFYCALEEGRQITKGSCYFFSSTTTYWQDAREKCLEMGSDLVKIDNDDEFLFLERQTVGDTWVGMHDQESDHTYKWVVDGSVHVPSDSEWWSSGEPNNYGHNEHCIHYKKVHNHLNDVGCGLDMRYICEMPFIKLLL